MFGQSDDEGTYNNLLCGIPSSELHQVCHTARELPSTEYVIAHGPSKFITPENVDKLRRQKREGRTTHRDCYSYMPDSSKQCQIECYVPTT